MGLIGIRLRQGLPRMANGHILMQKANELERDFYFKWFINEEFIRKRIEVLLNGIFYSKK